MADVTHAKIGEIDSISGVLEGITFYRAAAGLGVSAFGVSISDLAPTPTRSTTTPRRASAAGCSLRGRSS